MFYILNDKKPIKTDSKEWSDWVQKIDRQVKFTTINGIDVSTVFLGLDHNFFGGEPLLFETMVFDDTGKDIYMKRYSTWDAAEEGHEKAKEWVFKYIENGFKDLD